MNEVSLKTKWGIIFWVSLVAYCITFWCFYLNTQYVSRGIDKAFYHNGPLSSLNESACSQMKGCTNLVYLGDLKLDKATNKYTIQASLTIKNENNLNPRVFDSLLDAKRGELPEYLNKHIGKVEIVELNGRRIIPAIDKRAAWFKSMSDNFPALIDNSIASVFKLVN